MGQRGPRKTPAAVKKQRGTYRPDRDAEPEFEGKAPPPPAYLREDVAAEWRRLAAILEKRGLLTEVDWIAWQLGMAAYAAWLESSEELAREGVIISYTESGYPVQSPHVAIAQRAWASTLKFCREFGLTPSARCGLKIDGAEEEDPFAEHLKARGK